MKGKIKNGEMTYGIIGIGRFGYSLAVELYEAGIEFIVIDRDEEKIRQMREMTEYAYIVKSIDKKALMETGIQNCDVVIVCIGETMDISILTTLHLVSFGIPHVISKANSAEHGEILEKLGAEVVYPEHDMAVRLANRLKTTSVLDFVELSECINISKLHIPKHFVGKSVMDINLREKFGLNIVAIENKGKVIEIVQPDYIFHESDILYLSGSKDGMIKLSGWLQE